MNEKPENVLPFGRKLTGNDCKSLFTKRVSYVRPGYIGITLGGIEHVMPEWEARLFAGMIDDILDNPTADYWA